MKALYLKQNVSNLNFKKRIWYYKRNFFSYEGQDGFFLASINEVFDVKYSSMSKFLQKKDDINKKFDVLFVNYKSRIEKDNLINKELINIVKGIDIIRILFIGSARPEIMPDNEVLDNYDLIFKREPYKNLDKYNLSDTNRKKIFSTILTCNTKRTFKFKFSYTKIKIEKNKKITLPYKYDIFYTGRVNNQTNIREETLNYIKREKLNFYGGLQGRDNKYFSSELSFKQLKFFDYIKATKQSKINLALSGIGPFTFRHLEIWDLGCFMLCDNHIKNMQLPFNAIENIHYVSFNNFDDMINKIKYYLSHNKEREKIAKAGKRLLDEEYRTEKHGEYIKNIIAKKIDEKNSYSN